MKIKQRPLRMGDLLDGQRQSVFDLTPAIDRLNRELQHVEIVEGPKQEEGRIFPIITKSLMPGQPAERQFDGSFAPILVVRFPIPVDDRDEWAKRCKEWQRPPVNIEVLDTEDSGPCGIPLDGRAH